MSPISSAPADSSSIGSSSAVPALHDSIVAVQYSLAGSLEVALKRRGFFGLETRGLTPIQEDKQQRRLETALMELFRDEGSQAAFRALYAQAAPQLATWVLHCMRGRPPVADPAEVARLIVKAADAKRPKAVYTINYHLLVGLLSHLPARLKEFVVRKSLK